jgi:hypothetical protein
MLRKGRLDGRFGNRYAWLGACFVAALFWLGPVQSPDPFEKWTYGVIAAFATAIAVRLAMAKVCRIGQVYTVVNLLRTYRVPVDSIDDVVHPGIFGGPGLPWTMLLLSDRRKIRVTALPGPATDKYVREFLDDLDLARGIVLRLPMDHGRAGDNGVDEQRPTRLNLGRAFIALWLIALTTLGVLSVPMPLLLVPALSALIVLIIVVVRRRRPSGRKTAP